MPLIEKPWIDLSQGLVHQTGNPLDVALSGKGFFTVGGPSGPLYTRNGSFRVSSSGAVTTAEGNAVRLAGGTALKIQNSVPLTMSANGTLMQNGVALGRLDIVDFPNGGLTRQGPSNFRSLDPAVTGTAATETEVYQGKLETANVSAPEAAVRLVYLTRQFESLQRVLVIGSDMNRKAIDELAKI